MENTFKNFKYFIQTFGCQMNVHESEKVAGVLHTLGMTETTSTQDADVVVINTCTIRENADKKIESFIGNLKQLKKQGITKCIVVFGCLVQIEEKVTALKQKFPFIDIVFGTMNLDSFKPLLFAWAKENKQIIELKESRTAKDIKECYRTSGTNAWVNISFGCNNYCTYCIVPYVRGREISRPMEDILEEVQEILKSGYKQITLLGQNVNSYGNDVEDKNVTFANLLREIDKFDYKFRLRFMTSHPKDISPEVVDVIKNSTHICHYLHLPVQSGSTKILNAMNRKYTREHYLDTIKMVKEKIPDIGLTTDIIVGFPGETEEDFEDTLSLVKEVGYQQIFGFNYSRRKNTVADKMENQIPLATKKERLQRLIELERTLASEISEKQVGQTVEVLIEGTNKNYLSGSTDQNKNVNITLPANSKPEDFIGRFVNCKITKSKLTVLYGEIKDVIS